MKLKTIVVSLSYIGLCLSAGIYSEGARAEEKTRYLFRCVKAPEGDERIKRITVDYITKTDGVHPAQQEVSYTYEGPNSLGYLDQPGSSVSARFKVNREEADEIYFTDENGIEHFSLYRIIPGSPFFFNFITELPGDDNPTGALKGTVESADGDEVHFKSPLNCIAG